MTNYSDEFSALTELPTPRLALRPLQVEWAEPMFEAVHESRAELRRYMPWETDDLDLIGRVVFKLRETMHALTISRRTLPIRIGNSPVLGCRRGVLPQAGALALREAMSPSHGALRDAIIVRN